MICVVTVNYRSAEVALRSVEASLAALEPFPGSWVALVDNDSRDGSAGRLAEGIETNGWGDRVQLIRSPRNGGFGYGCNVGIRAALASARPPEFIHLVNPDAFARLDSIQVLVDFFRAHPRAGIVGSAIGREGEWSPVNRFPTVAGEFEGAMRLGLVTQLLRPWTARQPQPRGAVQTDWVCGAAMMMRTALVEEVGSFDETFFLIFEETDLCRRAKDVGWEVWVVPQSRVVHAGGISVLQGSDHPTPRYWFDSRRHYFRKHHGFAYLWAANFARVAGTSIWQLRRRIQGKPEVNPPGFLRDFVRHSFQPDAAGTGSPESSIAAEEK